MSEEQQIKFERFINNRVERLVAQRTYNWKPIDYNNKHVCHQYLLSRIAPEYNVIKTLFNDLQQRDPNFAPESLFDFGSGIGTVTLYVSFTFFTKERCQRNIFYCLYHVLLIKNPNFTKL